MSPREVSKPRLMIFVLLFSNFLSGPIPAALHALRELKVLVLYKNQLNGEREDGLGEISWQRMSPVDSLAGHDGQQRIELIGAWLSFNHPGNGFVCRVHPSGARRPFQSGAS